MHWLKKYMPQYLKLAVPGWACVLIEVLVDLSLPTLTALIVNIGIAGGDLPYIYRTGGIMLGLALLGALSGLSRNWFSTRASQDLGTKLRADIFRKVQTLSLAAVQRFGPASLITRLTNDVMQIQNLSFMIMRIFVRAPLLLVGGVVMATLLDARMAMILLGVLPLMALLVYIRVKRGFPLFQKVQYAIDRVNGVMREYLAGVREAKVFNRYDYESAKFDRSNRDLTGLSITAARSMATILPLMLVLMNGSVVLVLWLGGLRINVGDMQVGDIIAFVNYFAQILQAMTMVSWIFTAGVRAKSSFDRIREVFAMEPGMDDPAQPAGPPARGRVEMADVAFCYPGQVAPVLQGISFAVEPGQFAAVIGSTGAGKSSLVNLIPRFYDATAGAVRVDGEDVRDFSREDLRSRIAIVPQQSLLFTGTIGDNLRWGKPDAADEEIVRAADIAQAAEFIHRMPQGYDTWLGQGGVNLSGGQKQRLCIARALVRRPWVLILDDSTSAVDMDTEQRIRQGLRAACRGMTVILIAQRIHSVMDADIILVMDEGRIIAQGNHKQLLGDCPIYRDIYRSQMGLDRAGREVV